LEASTDAVERGPKGSDGVQQQRSWSVLVRLTFRFSRGGARSH
jgi:hypothetical protein